MKCEDEDDNSFPSNTSIPSPSIDEVAVLEEQQLSSASLSLQVFCRPLQHSWLFLNRAWSQKHIQQMNIRQRLSPVMFSSDVHLTTGAFWLRWSAADAEERAEGNSKPLVLKACYLWLFKSALDGTEREQKVMWWPLVCCHSAVSSEFCTASSRERWQAKALYSFKCWRNSQCHHLCCYCRCLIIYMSLFLQWTILMATNINNLANMFHSEFRGHSANRSLAVVPTSRHYYISENSGAIWWNKASWKLHLFQIPQHCSTCMLRKVPCAPTWRFALVKSEPNNRNVRQRFKIIIIKKKRTFWFTFWETKKTSVVHVGVVVCLCDLKRRSCGQPTVAYTCGSELFVHV